MTDLPPVDPGADGIEQGKRLVRVSGDGGLSLADRLAERFHRLTWRTPLHALRLKGHHPLKLIAVADDPFLGDPDRGHALLDGMLSLRGETRNLHELHLDRPGFSPAFGEYLHSFAWLRDLSTVATRAHAAPIAEALMREWLSVHADHVAGAAWRADNWGRRILAWIAHAPLILSSTDLVYRSKVLNTLARGARHIDRVADKAPAGAPRIAAWCGVVAAGLIIPGGDPRRAFGEAGLARAIASGMFDDGGSVGRSPAAQLEIVQLLTMLRETYAARRLQPPEIVAATLHRAVTALLGLMHGDGGLSSWQGSGPMAAEMLAQVIDATGVRARPLRQAGEWGYQRLSAAKAVLIFDAAPPPVGRLVAGGCASTLAFEFSDGPNRIVVNCGGARAVTASVPAPLAEGLRTSAAHSTLIVGDSNSSAIHGDGTLGKGVVEVELTRQESDASSRIEASHDGYVRRFGLLHRRQVVLSGDGRDLRGEDSLLPSGRRKARGDTGFAIRFHLAPSVEVAATADGQAAILRLPGQSMWQFRSRGAAVSIEESIWIDGAGRPHATRQLVLTAMAPPGGAVVSWLFHRAR
ncbi:heparinase II/III family protein [Sphingomonas japonica]|uniref:Heparinase superfamily protein n=1 Tax=Sphingomonas japonica TaxID=511662 RepID=A0ABX0TYI5_9SPHN|nr:heparinase II/III family protein [Sphingomonas japonica]NIJ23378.1 putative heparinase superfamily protein [Sphingomonas japonica]